MFLKTAYCPRTAKIRYLLWSHLLSHLIAELFIVLFSGRDKENPSKADGRMKHVTSLPHVVWKNERGRPVTKKLATQCGGKHLRKEETLADSILTTPSTIKRVWVTSAKQLNLPSFANTCIVEKVHFEIKIFAWTAQRWPRGETQIWGGLFLFQVV